MRVVRFSPEAEGLATNGSDAGLAATAYRSARHAFASAVEGQPSTTSCLPHSQLNQHGPDELIQGLHDWCFSLPWVENEDSGISVPGSRALVLRESQDCHHDAYMTGREFAHIHPHPDSGSMHLKLPRDDATHKLMSGEHLQRENPNDFDLSRVSAKGEGRYRTILSKKIQPSDPEVVVAAHVGHCGTDKQRIEYTPNHCVGSASLLLQGIRNPGCCGMPPNE